ncbi:hypothetical protein ACEN9X_09205 [Mucilaginibacter sp. Mucisp86]|uniref:hypothetical protein n=1 Tax=Mucilaginibacter sp. Mucisp86 TaxID=3243060 RepID=UPI0039B3C63D
MNTLSENLDTPQWHFKSSDTFYVQMRNGCNVRIMVERDHLEFYGIDSDELYITSKSFNCVRLHFKLPAPQKLWEADEVSIIFNDEPRKHKMCKVLEIKLKNGGICNLNIEHDYIKIFANNYRRFFVEPAYCNVIKAVVYND